MTDLTTMQFKANESATRAFADLDDLARAVTAAQNSLRRALTQSERASTLASFDRAALQEFLDKPYLVRSIGNGEYELAVPRFIGFRAGWPVRHDGPYSIFRVSRFINFINPLPTWLAGELGFEAPSWRGALEGNILDIAVGDPAAVYEKLGGKKTITRRDGSRLYLRPASRFDILRRIIREEGFLPFTPQPIPGDLLREKSLIARDERGKPAFTLRPHQQRDYDRFVECGAVSVFAYPQTGKSYIALRACADLAGPKLILCPRRSLVDQWRARLDLFLNEEAAREVVVSTYQGARKHLDRQWSLVVFDEAHHMPADFAIENATAIKTVARIGLSATPAREDGQEDLIPALCGMPVGADWPVSAGQRPSVTVWIVRDEREKLKLAGEICARPVDGKTFIFTYRLQIGEAMARQLRVPFVSGKTKRPLEVLEENDVVVVSSVGNEGLSFPVRRVIEIDFLFGSKMEAGQRLGRLAYEITGKDKPGEHHVLMTSWEYQRYSKRLLIYEQWGLDVDVRTPEGETERARSSRPASSARRTRVTRTPAARKTVSATNGARESDDIQSMLDLPPIAAKISIAENAVARPVYVRQLFRLCFSAAFTSDEIMEGLALTGKSTSGRIRQACRALVDVGLFVQDGERYRVSQDEISRLRALAAAVRR